MSILTQIRELRHEAVVHGIPTNRVYLSRIKYEELKRELIGLAYSGATPDGCSQHTVLGMKVVGSSKPGIAIGR